MFKRLTNAFVSGVLALMLFSCDGCSKEDPYLNWEATCYSLSMKFEDADGKSFMDSIPITQNASDAPIEGVYREVLVDKNTNKFDLKSGRCNGNPTPELYAVRSYLDSSVGNECRLYYNDMISIGKYCRDTLIYELKFPALFGDDDVHRMVAYWTVPSDKLDNKHYAICNYIELDGQELQVVQKTHLMGMKSSLAITNHITIKPKLQDCDIQ